jgi:hypothetical protein
MVPAEFIIKAGDENLTSHSGLALIGYLLNRTGLALIVVLVFLSGAGYCYAESAVPNMVGTWDVDLGRQG